MLSRVRKNRFFRPLVRWLHQLAPDRYLTARIMGGPLRGRHMVLNLRYQMGYWLGLTEQDVVEAMQTVIGSGGVVYDVGAEIGYFSLSAAVVSGSGPVYAFEPNPANAAVIRRSKSLNSDLNLHVVEKAVGNRRDRVSFITFENRPDVSNASLLGRLTEIQKDDQTAGQIIDVEMIDLDSFSIEIGLTPDLVKVDVEGAEGMVLQGMSRLLTEARPYLIIEIHNEIAQHDVTSNVTAHGYETRVIGQTYDRLYPFRVLSLPPKRPDSQ